MRILIVEDDAVTRRMLQARLEKWGYEVLLAKDGSEAWAIMEAEDAPTFVILDWMIPDPDGLEICRRIRKREREEYTYVILLTAKGQREDVVQGMDAGADDYIIKPFDSRNLQVRLRAGRRILDLLEQLVAARESLRVLATRDPLTGLWNRASILDMLNRELARDIREGNPIGIIMADIDHFKVVNDSHGHLAGDAVLREVGRRMRLSIRPYDGIGRYGGEEFLAIFPGCDEPRILALSERLREAIAGTPMDTSEGRISITMSIGAASYADPADGNVEALIRAADIALYRAKEKGRNRVEFATAEDCANAASPSD